MNAMANKPRAYRFGVFLALLYCLGSSCWLTAQVETGGAGFTQLFNGKDCMGWKFRGGKMGEKNNKWKIVGDITLDPKLPSQFVSQKGEGTLLNGGDGRGVDIILDMTHGDCELWIDFNVAKGGNSGIYFHGRYEVQILDSFGKDKKDLKYGDCGGIYDTSPPKLNASLPAGRWQTFHIFFQAPRFDKDGKKTANAKFLKVFLNGKLIQENVEVNGPTTASLGGPERPQGVLLLQGDHGPVAFRNIRMRSLEKTKK